MKYYLYNKLSNNGIKPNLSDDIELIDSISLEYKKFFANLKPEDSVVIVGGDGTLNYLVNQVDCEKITNPIYYYAAGTGNDFLRDIDGKMGEEIQINQYLKNLPTVHVKEIDCKYINGIGYGIDGYCCEVADKIKRKTPQAKINYTSIAIKGLLFHFKPKSAAVTVDGRTYEFKHVWIAASMKGRFYGGGMMNAPEQKRDSGLVTVVIYHTPSKLKALMNFPNIFKGEHVKNTKMVKVFTGKKVEIKFKEPCALQIDGDTVLDVKSYSVEA